MDPPDGAVPGLSTPTTPGSSSRVGPPSTSTVARPETTTKSSSASTSSITPGVICQTPRTTRPSGEVANTSSETSGEPSTIALGSSGAGSSSRSATRCVNGAPTAGRLAAQGAVLSMKKNHVPSARMPRRGATYPVSEVNVLSSPGCPRSIVSASLSAADMSSGSESGVSLGH